MAEAVQSLPRLLRIPQPSPALAYAIRFGLVVSAALWIGNAPGLVTSHSTWILISVLMVMQPQTGGSLLKGLLRALGTAAAAFTAILLFGLWAQTPPLLVAGLFAVQAIAAYGNTGPRFQYAWFVWAFTTAIVVGDAMAGSGPVETVAFERASMVGIGILLVFVVDSLLWPARSEPSLRQGLAARARRLADSLKRAIEAPRDPAAGPPAAVSDAQTLAAQLGLLAAVRQELGVSRARVDALGHVALLLEALATRADALAAGSMPSEAMESRGRAFLAALDAFAQRVQAALQELARALEEARAPAPFADEVEQAHARLEAERSHLVQQLGWSAAFEGRAAEIRDLVVVLRTFEQAVTSADRPSESGGAASAQRFRPDPLRVKIGLRSGVAVVAAFLVPMVLGWPVNTMVAPMAFIAAAFNRGAAVQTLVLLAGIVALAWLLADLAIVYAMPHLGRAPVALLYPFAVASVFAYLRSKRPQLAMLPSIGGLIAILPVFSGQGAPTDVYGTYNTVCYVAVGLGVGWLSGRLLWPATASELFRRRAAAQLALCLENIRGEPEADDGARGLRIQEFVRASAQGSTQLATLHRQATLEPVERGLDEARRAVLLGLLADLNDAAVGFQQGWPSGLAERGDRALRPLLERLDHQDAASVASLAVVAARLRGESPAPSPDLAQARQAVEDHLEELRGRLGSLSGLTDAQIRDLLVRIDSRRRLLTRQLAMEAWLAEWLEARAPGSQRQESPGGAG